MAKIITVFNQKGGCGKTTTAMQVGGTLGLYGHSVLIIDMDPQGTATTWASMAGTAEPFPALVANMATYGGKIHRELQKLNDKYDFIILDCPPAINRQGDVGAVDVPSSALLVSDLALIPVIPAPADLWATVLAKGMAERAMTLNHGLKVRVVLTAVQKNLAVAREAISILQGDEEMPILEAYLGSRTAFRECQAYGTTVHGVRGATQAIAEVTALTDEVLGLLV